MKKEKQSQEFSFLDGHFANFLLRLSDLENEEEKNRFTHLIQQLSAALDTGDSCVELSGRKDDLQIMQKLPKTLCISEKEYQDGVHAPLVLFDDKLFLYRYFHYEFRLAEQIRSLAEKEHFPTEDGKALLDALFPPENLAPEEKDLQKEAARLTLTRQFAIISGGPGTGKTTTVVKILALLLGDTQAQKEAIPKIMLAAPTGKAAMRLGESVSGSIEKLDIDNDIKEAIPRTAITIHRLLGVRQNSCRFIHNSDNPLDCSIVVVDEASMVDVALMSKLVDALPLSCRLILLGDKDQLASVESGAVLSELLAGLPQCGVHLEKSYRFNPNIRELSLSVNKGNPDIAWKFFGESAQENLCLLSHDWFTFLGQGFIPYMKAVQDAVRKNTPGKGRVEPLFEALRSFQILCATRKGQRGVEQINQDLVRFFVRKNLCYPGRDGWYAGRPVMITRNDYQLGLFNGDVGICLPGGTEEKLVWFEHHEKGLIAVPYGRLPEHETSFAITIHKSQGSEFDKVAVLLPEKDHQGLSRELLYTGITRAKEKVWLLAEKDIFTAAVTRPVSRRSSLCELLKQTGKNNYML